MASVPTNLNSDPVSMDETDTLGAAKVPQVVDPAVSETKFYQEVDAFRKLEADHQRRGWWLLEASYPTVFVVFATPQLKPPAVVCGVLIDFTNYDIDPPSVRLTDPFTRRPYLAKELPTVLLRKQQANPLGEIAAGQPGAAVRFMSTAPLMQWHDLSEVPFLCIPGVREYHEHPAHTGDSWLAHRGLGEGTLFHILSTIYQYGIQPISEYGVGIRVVGFQQGEPPA